MKIAAAKRRKVYAFLDDKSINHRASKTTFRETHSISAPMYALIKREWEEERGLATAKPESAVIARKKIEANFAGYEYEDGQAIPEFKQYLDKAGNFDLKKAIAIHMEEIFDGLKKAAKAGNAQAGKILLQVNGALEEKPLVEVNFDIGALALQLVERPKVATPRVEELPAGLTLLRPELREDSGQGQAGDD